MMPIFCNASYVKLSVMHCIVIQRKATTHETIAIGISELRI